MNECEKNKIEPDPKKILGMTSEEILATFYENIQLKKDEHGWKFKINPSFYKAKILNYDLLDQKNGKVLISKGTKINQRHIRELENKVGQNFCIDDNSLIGMYIASDIIDEKSGKIYYEAGFEIDEEFLSFLENNKTKKIDILKIDNIEIGSYIRSSLQLDKARSREEALFEIFKILRPGEPPTIETAELLFNNLFFNKDRYDLSSVGRLKINSKFKKITDIKKYYSDIDNNENFEESLSVLAGAKKEVFEFFDNVKVNEDNEDLRKNRLELINMLCKTFQNFMNFQLLKANNE